MDDRLDTLAPVPPSVIEAVVRYDLDPVLAAVERVTPRSFGDIAKKLPIPTNQRASFAFAASREPLKMRFDGQQLAVSSVIEYEGRGWYRPPIGPEISAACGTAGVPRPRAKVLLLSDVTLTPEWNIRSSSRIADVSPYSDSTRDRCRVTPFRIDVTDKVMDGTRAALVRPLQSLDSAVARTDARARVEQWWRAMSRPIRLSDSVWLTINPSIVHRGSFRTDAGTLIVPLRLVAAPKIVTGNRPNDFDLFTPLPRLTRGETIGKGLRVVLEADVGYDVASVMLRRSLVQKRIEIRDRHLIIEDVELSGIGAGRVALGVRFGGSTSGRFYVIGTPRYDAETDQLIVPDLEYDLQTSDRLVRSVAWLKDDDILKFLRSRARFPVESRLEQLRETAEHAMNRQLSGGVWLVAQLEHAKPEAVLATRRAIRLRATTVGDAHLEIDRPVGTPRRPRRVAGTP